MFFKTKAWDEVVYWALDLETSSLDPREGVILSVGMVPIREGRIQWGERYYSLVRPEGISEADTEAIAIHHILPEELDDAPPLEVVTAEIARRLVSGEVLLVHHAPLDVGYLRKAFSSCEIRWPKPKVIDTQVLASRVEQRRHILQPYARPLPRSLPGLRETFDLPEFDPHHALSDALATAELFLALRARLDLQTTRQL